MPPVPIRPCRAWRAPAHPAPRTTERSGRPRQRCRCFSLIAEKGPVFVAVIIPGGDAVSGERQRFFLQPRAAHAEAVRPVQLHTAVRAAVRPDLYTKVGPRAVERPFGADLILPAVRNLHTQRSGSAGYGRGLGGRGRLLRCARCLSAAAGGEEHQQREEQCGEQSRSFHGQAAFLYNCMVRRPRSTNVPQKQKTSGGRCISRRRRGAPEGTRTHTLKAREPKSRMSTNSITGANRKRRYRPPLLSLYFSTGRFPRRSKTLYPHTVTDGTFILSQPLRLDKWANENAAQKNFTDAN